MTQTDRQREIHALLNEIPTQDRESFEAYYQLRFRQAQQQAEGQAGGGLGADPDAVEAALIETLMREASGRDDPLGLGEVPTPEGIYQVEPPESDPGLAAATPGAPRRAAAGGAPSGQMTRGRWAAVAVVVLLPLLLWLWPRGDNDPPSVPVAEAAGTPTPGSNDPTPTPLVAEAGGEVTVSSPASLEIRHDDQAAIFRVVASAATLGGAWSPEVQTGTVAWLNGAYINAAMCLPADAGWALALPRGTPITLRAASGGVRTFEVVRTRTVGRQQVEVLDQRHAGMTLLQCGGGGNQRQVVEAVERTQQDGPALVSRGEPVSLPGYAVVVVTGIQQIPATSNTPSGYQDLSVQVQIENPTDEVLVLATLADQLELGGLSAERLTGEGDDLDAKATSTARYRYRVPAQGGAAIWTLSAPTGEQAQVRLTISPAPERAPQRQLDAQLTPAGVQALATRDGMQLTLALVVTPTGLDPVAVDSSMVSVWSGSRSLPLAAGGSALPLLISPGVTTTLTLVTTAPDVGQVEVQIDQQRFRVTLP